MPARNKKPGELKPCHRCGSEAVVVKITANANTSRFIHSRHTCAQCGAWLGGRTIKKHTKEIISK